MNIYQQALNCCLDTESHLNLELEMFFCLYDHCGEFEYESKVFQFESEVYQKYQRKKAALNYTGMYIRFIENLTNTEVERYLTKNYSDEQFAAVILAHEVGLTKKQIQQIGSLRNKKNYDKILNFFLWNPEIEKYSSEYLQSDINKLQIYYVFDKDTEQEVTVCHRDGNYLINDNANIKFNDCFFNAAGIKKELSK